ncbi:MAG: S8 family serine peptidase, partial [Lachnospiraceae bacterium]
SIRSQQNAVVKKVEKALGKELDVRWHLTLAANIVSANVAFGDIDTIKAVDGVESVIIERRYEPAVTETTKAGPEMATSGEMIGSQTAWADGYTGAGSRIAIIDTGIDDDHQSFSSDALDYALAENAEAAGMSADEYIKGLDLLDEAEIKSVLRKLNVYSIDQTVTASDLFRDDKIAFGYNYVTQDLDITHEYDGAGEHGSHVAGIAAANKYVPAGDSYVNALEEVKVQGVAPDAQLLVMKVFGNAADGSTYSDGAYDSDYMAAIEDALILGADAVNLSLGSAAPGFEKEFEYDYADILNSLEKSDTVVSISQGNNASVGDNSFMGLAYREDNSFNTGGSPGSYTNSLAVASIDNTGYTGLYVMVGSKNMVFYTESIVNQKPFASLASEDELPYILLDAIGLPEQIEAAKNLIKGKIVLVSRGSTTFVEKCTLAAEAGAIGIMIYNNQPGTIRMALDDYTYDVPAVSITMDDADVFRGRAEDYGTVSAGGKEIQYFTGSLTVSKDVASQQGYPDYYTMSDFSSMGSPSSLTLKPEITAPGGNIYSVNGAHEVLYVDPETGEESLTGITGDSTTYESMSGTSMAAPQIAGMAAIVAQYIRENGLAEKEGISVRTLAQSLLMSTAEPVSDSYGEYYSVLKQGAGLADIGNAINADCYILMDKDATESYADGKVKAELGDDPDRTGVYSYSFTLNNMSDEERSYYILSGLFNHYPYDTMGEECVLNDTELLSGVVEEYTVDGKKADTVSVPAGG